MAPTSRPLTLLPQRPNTAMVAAALAAHREGGEGRIERAWQAMCSIAQFDVPAPPCMLVVVPAALTWGMKQAAMPLWKGSAAGVRRSYAAMIVAGGQAVNRWAAVDSLAPREKEVLEALVGLDFYATTNALGKVYWRPMDVGGFDGSHHSRTLAKLVRLGLAARRRRESLAGIRSSWLYCAADPE